jgi:hypothetical protein
VHARTWKTSSPDDNDTSKALASSPNRRHIFNRKDVARFRREVELSVHLAFAQYQRTYRETEAKEPDGA